MRYRRTVVRLVLAGVTIVDTPHASAILQTDPPAVMGGSRAWQVAADVGPVVEAEQEFVRRTFTLRNTGDTELRIASVRVSCHCTVVEFDSVIAPGGCGTIRQQVSVEGFHGGPFERGVEVISNAGNMPRVIFYVHGVLRADVDVVPGALRIRSGPPLTSSPVLQVRSRRADMRVTEVVFVDGSAQGKVWRPRLELPLTFETTPGSGVGLDGYHETIVHIGADIAARGKLEGTFLIRTNYPQGNETAVRGVIDNP